MTEQLFVSSRESEVCKFALGHPANCGAINRTWFMGHPTAPMKPEIDGLLRIGVRKAVDQFENLDITAKLLVQFATETLFECFTGLALTARKLPEPAEVRVGMTLRDE
jgi:hypothetical protein